MSSPKFHADKSPERRCYIVLPCYNEEGNISMLIERISESLRHLSYEVIAVNDGSKDGTYEILVKLQRSHVAPMRILNHDVNRGLAAALRTGLTAAISITQPEDAIITMDADLTHDPALIPEMVQALNEYDLVICSRYVKGGRQLGVPLHRRILSRGLSVLARVMVSSISVKDVSSGYRCFKASILMKMLDKYNNDLIESRGFEAALELLLKAVECGARIEEIPLVLDYRLKKGRSKMRVFRGIFKYIKLLLRRRNK